jgi:hopanoid-associated phosphorylase
MACEIIVVSGMAFEAELAEGPGIESVYGLNRAKLSQAIEEAIKNGAKGIMSFGTAAGLSPELSAGAIVIADKVHAQKTFATDSAWSEKLKQLLPEAIVGGIVGVDAALVGASEKSQLYTHTGAVAADMESHLVAQLAEQHHLPFAVLRVVLDDAGCTLPPAVFAAVTPEGNINYKGLFASLLAHLSQIPELLRLANASAIAKRSLLRCGNLLKGSRFGLVNLG